MNRHKKSGKDPTTIHDKWFKQRDDLTGEHKWGDAGQIIFAVLFFGIWAIDSFYLRYTTQLNGMVPVLLRKVIGFPILFAAGCLAYSGLKIVFSEVRENPLIIRKGVFNIVRHPIYLSEILLYLGCLILNISLAAAVAWIAALIFLHYISGYEERLLLERFGEDYEIYTRDVGMWIPRVRRK